MYGGASIIEQSEKWATLRRMDKLLDQFENALELREGKIDETHASQCVCHLEVPLYFLKQCCTTCTDFGATCIYVIIYMYIIHVALFNITFCFEL